MRMTPFKDFSWSLRSCGLHGHVTYRPTEQALAARLHAPTAAGEAWRCLRCEDFVVGEPHASGPADEAPIVLRGKALKDAAILRFLAVERGVRGLLLLVLAYGIHRFDGSHRSLQRTFDEYLPLLRPLATRLGVDLQSTGPVKLIEKALSLDHSTLIWVTLGVLAYGVLQLTEATGLWLMKRWGEYVAVVGTSLFIPLEVYELVEGFTVLKMLAFVVNIAAVVYLIWSKRLFGVRGGHAAFEAERHAESLLEVEHAALADPSS
ncbi:DUF2127 domain-containing protein [Nocardioides montaniterrae]